MNGLYRDAGYIIHASIAAVLPDAAVRRALEGMRFPGKVILVAVGKAAWQMAKTATDQLGDVISSGIVITKYGHVKAPLPRVQCREAGHPVPDENTFLATQEALSLVQGLAAEDTVLFLLSGGGSALFEKPLVPGEELQDITKQLLRSGADIVQMNVIRKRLSAVKGGRFARLCAPAQIQAVVLSDILGDPLDMIASGPACPDSSTCAQALEIAQAYGLALSAEARECLRRETPKNLDNVTTRITGSVKQLCDAAALACRELGYDTVVLTHSLSCEAKIAGEALGTLAKRCAGSGRKLALIAGGETVVKVIGSGKGGRNQELALAAAQEICGLDNVAVFSVGSDGTDGPTDAAGGYVDGTTARELARQGIVIPDVLKENDAFHALEKTNGLIFTGPTGTNVNDVSVVLIGS